MHETVWECIALLHKATSYNVLFEHKVKNNFRSRNCSFLKKMIILIVKKRLDSKKYAVNV